MNDDKKPLYSVKLNTRIDDINYGNHVCHSKYLNYLHQTRISFLNSLGFSEGDFFGASLIMLNLDIKYLNECFLNDLLEVTITNMSIEGAKIEISYSIFNHTRNLSSVTAKTTMGLYDRTNNKLKRPSQECIQLIKTINNG